MAMTSLRGGTRRRGLPRKAEDLSSWDYWDENTRMGERTNQINLSSVECAIEMPVFNAVQARYPHESMVDALPKKSLFMLRSLRALQCSNPPPKIEINAKSYEWPSNAKPFGTPTKLKTMVITGMLRSSHRASSYAARGYCRQISSSHVAFLVFFFRFFIVKTLHSILDILSSLENVSRVKYQSCLSYLWIQVQGGRETPHSISSHSQHLV